MVHVIRISCASEYFIWQRICIFVFLYKLITLTHCSALNSSLKILISYINTTTVSQFYKFGFGGEARSNRVYIQQILHKCLGY